eukprot:Colp12_sorted_trinity150504_noHs@21557
MLKVESCKTASTSAQEEKTTTPEDTIRNIIRGKLGSPNMDHKSGSNTKVDKIAERVKFSTEKTRSIQKTCNVAIEPIKDASERQEKARQLEVMIHSTMYGGDTTTESRESYQARESLFDCESQP